jgi:hypothetical protein
VKLLSNKPANLLTKYEIQQIQNQGMTHQTPNNEKPKQPSFHVHACADYANENLPALYTHVTLFSCADACTEESGRGKKTHTKKKERERERESMLCLDVGCFGIFTVAGIIDSFFYHVHSKSERETNVKWQI